VPGGGLKSSSVIQSALSPRISCTWTKMTGMLLIGPDTGPGLELTIVSTVKLTGTR